MVFSIQLAIFLFIEILRFNCEINNPWIKHKNWQIHKQVLPAQPVLRCRILASYVPLQGLGSESEPALKLSAFVLFKNHEFRSYNKKYWRLNTISLAFLDQCWMINAESRGCLPFCMEGGQGFFYNVLFECNGGSFQIVFIFGMGIGICVPDTKQQSYRFLVDNIILVDNNKTFCDIF